MESEFYTVEINSFGELAKLKEVFEKQNKVALDIRNLEDLNERRRVMDFATGVSFGRDLKIKSINKEGVFLIYDEIK